MPAVAHHRLRGSASLIPTPVAGVPFVADVGVGRDRFRHGVADVARYRLPGAVVAAVVDPADQLGDRGLVRVVGDRRGLGDSAGLDGQHAGYP